MGLGETRKVSKKEFQRLIERYGASNKNRFLLIRVR